jgi:hypothetical protein
MDASLLETGSRPRRLLHPPPQRTKVLIILREGDAVLPHGGVGPDELLKVDAGLFVGALRRGRIGRLLQQGEAVVDFGQAELEAPVSALASRNSVMTPAWVIRPILSVPSVNQREER